MNTEELKHTITQKVEKACGKTDLDIIFIEAGILVQGVSAGDLTKLQEAIFSICTEMHRSLPQGESTFPFQIYCYAKHEDAFKVDAGFKTKPHDYPNGIHNSYMMAGDAIVAMREIDAEAILYGIRKPFSLRFKSRSDSFAFFEHAKYRELAVNGCEINIENLPVKKINGNTWEITIQ
jgi:hypothetical protein